MHFFFLKVFLHSTRLCFLWAFDAKVDVTMAATEYIGSVLDARTPSVQCTLYVGDSIPASPWLPSEVGEAVQLDELGIFSPASEPRPWTFFNISSAPSSISLGDCTTMLDVPNMSLKWLKFGLCCYFRKQKVEFDGLVEKKNLSLSGSAIVSYLHSNHHVGEVPMEMLKDSFGDELFPFQINECTRCQLLAARVDRRRCSCVVPILRLGTVLHSPLQPQIVMPSGSRFWNRVSFIRGYYYCVNLRVFF